MLRVYLSEVIGTGTELDPYRPAVADVLSWWSGHDGRYKGQGATGYYLVVAHDASEAEHAAAVAQTETTHLDIGADWSALVADLPDRDGLVSLLGQLGVPDDGVDGVTVAQALTRILRRHRLRYRLRDVDFINLDIRIGTIPAATRIQIEARLAEFGLDYSGNPRLRDLVMQVIDKTDKRLPEFLTDGRLR